MVVSVMPHYRTYKKTRTDIYPVTVHCFKCHAFIELDAEFQDNKFIRIVPTRHFIQGYKGLVHCHCGGDVRIFLPHWLKF